MTPEQWKQFSSKERKFKEYQRALDYSMGYMQSLRDQGLKVGDGHYNDCSYTQMEIIRYAREIFTKDLKGNSFIYD